jgi:hypothetical protein
MKTITSIVCALIVLGSVSFAADTPPPKKGCCEATVEAGLKCKNKCCVKAAKAGKVCQKCHPKKVEDKK